MSPQAAHGSCCWLRHSGYRNHGAGRGVAPSQHLGKSQSEPLSKPQSLPVRRVRSRTLKEGFTGAKSVVCCTHGQRDPRCLHPHPACPRFPDR